MLTAKEYFAQVEQVMPKLPEQQITEIANLMFAAYRRGATIFVMGNGGSAATASHFACDMGKGTAMPGKPRFKVIALTDNIPLMTAWANDTAYENIFAEQLRNLVQPGDVVIGISGSGNSSNILNALALANQCGAETIGLTGYKGGKMQGIARTCLIVPSTNMQVIEDLHMIIAHCLFTQLKSRIEEGQ